MAKKTVSKASQKSINISKGIIFAFFAGYLFFYGIGLSIFITEFQQHNPGVLPIFVNYIPLLFFVVSIFLILQFIIFIRNANLERAREKRSRRKTKFGSIYKQALFLVIFIFAFIPLLSPVIDQGKNDQNFSVYNDAWNGASEFKAILEDEGYDVMNIQSSLSATERLNKSVCLILLGCNAFYNPVYEIPYFIDFFDKKNALLLCHDHGSTSTLLWQIFTANMLDPNIASKVPVAIFPNGILRDNQSYNTNPEFPVIVDFNSQHPHPTTEGVKKVILSRATAVIDPIPYLAERAASGISQSPVNLDEISQWEIIGRSSFYSYIDKDGNKRFNSENDSIDLSSIANVLNLDVPEQFLKIPLAYQQPVFMAKETDNVRVFVCGDASLFNNELIREGGYDNAKFALNIIKWLTRNENKSNWVIAFDEAHIRPEYSRDISSAGIYGFIIQYVVHLSTNPITAWIYPLLAVYTLRKYLPKKDQEEEKKKVEKAEKKEEKERFRTSSFFAEKIQWYHDKRHFEGALKLLFRRLERKLNAQLKGQKITTQNVINLVIAKEGRISRLKERRIARFMDKMLAIKEGKGRERKVRSEKEFEELFFEMEWMMKNI
ncbi:MAG: hypothetical protein ACTSVV_18960 [Promethearchaeota archaeon]